MSVEVSIPTILRTHTGGKKRVRATGPTLQAVLSGLDTEISDGDSVTILPAVAGG